MSSPLGGGGRGGRAARAVQLPVDKWRQSDRLFVCLSESIDLPARRDGERSAFFAPDRARPTAEAPPPSGLDCGGPASFVGRPAAAHHSGQSRATTIGARWLRSRGRRRRKRRPRWRPARHCARPAGRTRAAAAAQVGRPVARRQASGLCNRPVGRIIWHPLDAAAAQWEAARAALGRQCVVVDDSASGPAVGRDHQPSAGAFEIYYNNRSQSLGTVAQTARWLAVGRP
jgi:hypothetical protein